MTGVRRLADRSLCTAPQGRIHGAAHVPGHLLQNRGENSHWVTKGVLSISLGGRPLEENLIPPVEDSTLHTVEVNMGLPESER